MKNTKMRIILGIIGAIMLIVVFFLVMDFREEGILKDTINTYVEEGKLPEKSSTTGEYHRIEETVLEFLVGLDDTLDDFEKTCEETKKFEYYTVEHAYNSLKDDFKNDKEMLAKYEKELNEQLDLFIELNDYDKLVKKFHSDESEYYNDLYIELLGGRKEFDEAVKTYESLQDMFDAYFDVANRYIDFLQNSSLIIEDDKEYMMFKTDEEVETYNNFIDEINNLEMDF